jgi:hypothetical protein
VRITARASAHQSKFTSKGEWRLQAYAIVVRFWAGVLYAVRRFIFRRLTSNTCDESSCVAANDPNPLELKQPIYSQRDATFRGVEFQSQYDLMPLWTGMLGVEDQFDTVRATFTEGTNVPRIPPVRVGGGVYWRDDNCLAPRESPSRLCTDQDCADRRDADAGLYQPSQ